MKIIGKEYKYRISKLFVSSNNKNYVKYSAYATFLLIFGLVCLLPNVLKSKPVKNHLRFPTDLKYILFWQHHHGEKHKFELRKKYNYKTGQSSFINKKCKYYNCYISFNQSLLGGEANFDGIVFNSIDVANFHHHTIGLDRNPQQKYIFHSEESSEKHPVCNPLFDDFFNLTWTYKLKSDLPEPFFSIFDQKQKLIGPKTKMGWNKRMKHVTEFHNKIKEKTKAVAWILPKCNLKKKHKDFLTEFGNELISYNYTLDIFGPCSKTVRCPYNDFNECYEMVEKEYFFSLVLEDSYAEDYLTDKILNPMNRVIIPIVLSGANYSRFLPPSSYIDVLAFDMKKLGAIIDYLIKTPSMYEYFFDWKKHYFYKERPKSFLCDLCAKLNDPDGNIYEDFRTWWNPGYSDICERIQLVKLYNKLE